MDEIESSCRCYQCQRDNGEAFLGMILCADCGNKRCPRATDHRNRCTRSNAPGQKGSRYDY